MSNTMALVQRNLRVFGRDRAQVFFSLFAPMILLMLYVFFLGRLQVETMTEGMQGSDSSKIEAFIYAWVLVGMVAITTLTTSFSALASFVDDRVTGRFKEFRVSPVRSTELMVGYMVAGLVISLTLSLLVLAVGSVVFGFFYGTWSTPAGYAQAVAYTALLCLVFSGFAGLMVTFVRSSAAFSGLATLVGTLVGFLAFAYIPVGSVSPGVASVLNTLPFAQGTFLLREPLAGPALERMIEDIPEPARAEVITEVREIFGFDTYIGDLQLTHLLVVGIFLVLAVVFALAASGRIRKLTTSDMR